MRIARHTIFTSVLNNLNKLMSRQERLHRQMSGGKRILSPSDDPAGFAKSLAMKADLDAGRQYARNIDNVIPWFQATSEALSLTSSALQRANELAVEAADTTKSQDELNNMAAEVEEILKYLVDVANTTYQGRSIFAGNETLQPAFTVTGYDPNGYISGVAYNGDSGVRKVETGKGRLVAVNSLGSNETGGAPRAVFRDTTAGIDVFQTLMDLRDHMLAGNTDAIMQSDMGDISSCLTNVLVFQAEIGAKQNSLEQNSTELGDREANLIKQISDNEDLDYAEALLHFSEVQNTYKAALAAAARIMEITLMDFLR